MRSTLHAREPGDPAVAREQLAGRRENAMSDKSLVHDGGESYCGVVPAKQPNKSGRPLAEAVEGRPQAKENTQEPNPRRTQSRESGPSRLARVREASVACASTPNILSSEARTVCVGCPYTARNANFVLVVAHYAAILRPTALRSSSRSLVTF